VCTAALLQGPGVYARIREEIDQWLRERGHAGVADATDMYLDAARHGRRLDTEGSVPRVLDDRCVRCGTCVAACFREALSLGFSNDTQQLQVDAQRCIRCGLCISVCPHHALRG
jgi:ferredoxin